MRTRLIVLIGSLMILIALLGGAIAWQKMPSAHQSSAQSSVPLMTPEARIARISAVILRMKLQHLQHRGAYIKLKEQGAELLGMEDAKD